MKRVVRYFLQGLLTLVPLVLTVYLVYVVFNRLNEAIFTRIGSQVAQGEEAQWIISLLGIAATVAFLIVVGFLTSNFIGRSLVAAIELLFRKLPLVKLLYGSIKDLLSAFVGDKKSFDRPVLVSLVEGGAAKVVGFVTRDSLEFLGIEGHVAVYLPQSYNFAGNLVLFPTGSVTPLEASSADVMTFLVSGGVSGQKEKKDGQSKTS